MNFDAFAERKRSWDKMSEKCEEEADEEHERRISKKGKKEVKLINISRQSPLIHHQIKYVQRMRTQGHSPSSLMYYPHLVVCVSKNFVFITKQKLRLNYAAKSFFFCFR